jgi:hypothetical protein
MSMSINKNILFNNKNMSSFDHIYILFYSFYN